MVTFFTNIGGWVGLLFSVIVFSSLLGDHRLARLAQYVLVGLSMGYLAVLAIQFGVRPLVVSVQIGSVPDPGLWATLVLAALLFVAGTERMFRRGREAASSTLLRWLGMIPLGLMIGVGVGALLIGVLQGTLLPQATLLITGVQIDQAVLIENAQERLLMLIVSAGVLFHLSINPERHLNSQLAPLRQLMRAWMWIGQRALLLVAGMFFVRIFAARYMLLIGLVNNWWQQIQTSNPAGWLGTFWGM